MTRKRRTRRRQTSGRGATKPRRSDTDSWLRSVPAKIAWTVVSILIGSFVTALLTRAGVFDFLRPLSLIEQLDAARTEAAKEGLTQVALEQVNFHGGGGPDSYLMVLRDEGFVQLQNPFGNKNTLGSDEIRVYDVVGSDLRLQLRFRPDLDRETYPDGQIVGRPLIWDETTVLDLNEDGLQEAIGSLAGFYMYPEFPSPVMVGWDSRRSTYLVQPLLAVDPKPSKILDRGPYGEAIQRRFHDPYLIRNLHGEQRFRAFPVTGFAFDSSKAVGGPSLITASLATAESHADEGDGGYEIREYAIATLWPQPRLFDCSDSRRAELTLLPKRVTVQSMAPWLRDYGRKNLSGC